MCWGARFGRAHHPQILRNESQVFMRLTSLVCAVSLLLGNTVFAADAVVERKTVSPGISALRGNAKAPVTLVVFSDFECPFCARLVPTLTELEAKNHGNVKIAFRQLPLPFHKNARLAAVAALAAGDQGKFWEMHDLLFTHANGLDRAAILSYAQKLKLDVAKFTKSIDDGRFLPQVEADISDAQKLGANGTPTVFVNGRAVVGAQPVEEFQKVIDEELAQRR